MTQARPADVANQTAANASGGRVAMVSQRCLLLMMILGFGLASPGCIIRSGHTIYALEWSPDSSHVAFMRCGGLGWAVPFTMGFGGPITFAAHVNWALADSGATEVKSLQIDTACLTWSNPPQLAFSPDSRHLAVASGWHVTVIEVESARRWEVSTRPEWVTCLFWSSPHEVVYVTATNLHGVRSDRTVWLQDIHRPQATRKAIYREEGVFANYPIMAYYALADGSGAGWPMEHPSPQGRYLVLASEIPDGRFTLLDVQTGRACTLGSCRRPRGNVTWRPDESAVVCAAEGRPVLLADTRNGRIRNLSPRLHKSFPLAYLDDFEPLWTADGQYIVVNAAGMDGCLLRPDPWDIVPVGRRIRERLESKPKRGLAGRTRLWRFPVAGWVVCNAPDGGFCLSDYEARTVAPLSAVPPRRLWLWRFSPDGRSAAKVGEDGKSVEVVPINLPGAETAGAP